MTPLFTCSLGAVRCDWNQLHLVRRAKYLIICKNPQILRQIYFSQKTRLELDISRPGLRGRDQGQSLVGYVFWRSRQIAEHQSQC